MKISQQTDGAEAPKISVVVPVYKVEKFVAECLESILAQDFDSFEVVVVDDGSPDNSGKICDEFAARDSRLRVFHEKNGGVNIARELGVGRSRGEWICFVDSDDILPPHALAPLYAAAEKFPDADIVEGESVGFRESGELRETISVSAKNRSRESLIVSGLEYAKEVASLWQFFAATPWRKIIRRDVLLKTEALKIPRELHYANDTMMDLIMATGARNVVKIFDNTYCYRANDTGIVRSAASKARYGTVEYTTKLWNFAKQAFAGKGEEWQIVWKILIAGLFPGAFIRAPGKFLKHPQIRPFVSVVKSPELAKCKIGDRRALNLVLLGTKFPFSLLPEPVFRFIPRVGRDLWLSARRRFRRS